MTTKIKSRIYLPPKFLNSNIISHLMDTLEKNVVGTCNQDHGHIISVKKIVKIINSEDTVFTLIFEAETLKPERGKEIKGKVCMIFQDGIFMRKGNQKMLIPASHLKDYTFDSNSNTYITNEKTIKEGDDIQAIVTAVKYSNKNFSCFGSLKE